ncbi:unnamed protein product (macronuclear) [Paramecium tetraurelia]|uniref:FPL domain-containing protein n=1 Tax=Paramecium tetraurelia TaxID=5888 RepID=A0DCU4_PARTE|nr:uncharacterized protein GSPATT00015720001 [Paramecium tetraurelia]CAK80861.1 unnamed protein product [Paramecium tetraurelia]|eukprot:XP_001448258.1 hypothetical protein (macronuclear) [Paramecium tetraurelia strain d4-2]
MQQVKRLHKDLTKPEKSHKYKQIIEELSEYFLFGDHQQEELFDYFAEHNILSLFYQKLKSSNHQLTIFIIERMSMIITNLQNPLNLNYVLSNPVLHDFINFNYDFNIPEIVDYYVNFLKTIAIRINRDNFYLYFNQRYCTFPLLWQAQKFINYPDQLVKNTIQNIVLSLSKLSSEPKSEKQTESVIYNQTKIMIQFKHYLTSSPFIQVYVKYIIQIQNLLESLNLDSQDEQDKLEDILMFFNDLITECPFLSTFLEKLILDQLIQPILDCLLLNKSNTIKVSYEVGLLTIYLFLTRLPIVYSIMSYFCKDQIYIDNAIQHQKLQKQSQKWVYDTKNMETEFQNIFLKEYDDIEERNNQFIDYKKNNEVQNPYKNHFLELLRSKHNTLLLLYLSIWLVAKQNNYQIPSLQIIKLLQLKEEIVFSKQVLELIILLLVNEELKELEQLYEDLKNKLISMISNLKVTNKKLSEGLSANWDIIEHFDWHKFKDSKPVIKFEDLKPYVDNSKLSEFKYVYLWVLVTCLIKNSQKQRIEKPYHINQEIELNLNCEFIQIMDSQHYLILDLDSGYLIYTCTHNNQKLGTVKFVQPLKAIQCSFINDTLILESNKLCINSFKPYHIKCQKDVIPSVIDRIYQAQQSMSLLIINKLEALL